jgi:hypothetical protein
MAGRFGSPTAEAMGYSIRAATVREWFGVLNRLLTRAALTRPRDHPMEYLF